MVARRSAAGLTAAEFKRLYWKTDKPVIVTGILLQQPTVTFDAGIWWGMQLLALRLPRIQWAIMHAVCCHPVPFWSCPWYYLAATHTMHAYTNFVHSCVFHFPVEPLYHAIPAYQ